MANGKVDFFNDTGGYGFISTEDEDDDVFFHME
ncbi:MAG: cold shock domain-containing protein, partial [Halorubrum sp.]